MKIYPSDPELVPHPQFVQFRALNKVLTLSGLCYLATWKVGQCYKLLNLPSPRDLCTLEAISFLRVAKHSYDKHPWQALKSICTCCQTASPLFLRVQVYASLSIILCQTEQCTYHVHWYKLDISSRNKSQMETLHMEQGVHCERVASNDIMSNNGTR